MNKSFIYKNDFLRKLRRRIKKTYKYGKKFIKRGFRYVKKNVSDIIYETYVRMIRSSSPIVPNRIVIATNTFNYTCNPKYIYEELMRRNKDLDIYWIVSDVKGSQDSYPADAKLIKLKSRKCIKMVYSAKVWINNGIVFSNYFDKREGQIYLQTMHGSLGIKKLDNAVKCRNERGKNGQRVVRREEENTDIVFTNSKFEEDVFRTVFWHDSPMERLGHARTDVLFETDDSSMKNSIRQTLKESYNICETDKLVMYAPTHRAKLTASDLDIDYPKLCAELSKKLGGKYTALLRLHDRSFKLLDKIAESIDAGVLEDEVWTKVGSCTGCKFTDVDAGCSENYKYAAILKAAGKEIDVAKNGIAATFEPSADGAQVSWKGDEAGEYDVYRKAVCDIRNLSMYPDMQELMLVADVGITDYSSWIYDYVNTRKPGFIYAADIDSYTLVTGFAYPLTQTPFAVCEDNDDLIEAVRNFDMDEFVKGVNAFLDEKEAVDDGHSAQRIVDRILELMNIQ